MKNNHKWSTEPTYAWSSFHEWFHVQQFFKSLAIQLAGIIHFKIISFTQLHTSNLKGSGWLVLFAEIYWSSKYTKNYSSFLIMYLTNPVVSCFSEQSSWKKICPHLLIAPIPGRLRYQGLPTGAGGHSWPRLLSVGKRWSRSPFARCSAPVILRC